MKLTVITVCFNAEKVIEQTIKSVISQRHTDIEYIIIDGRSSDNTLDIINKYSKHINRVISEPDRGIYDAMNKGIKLSAGDWILFMNAGDSFVNNDVVTDLFSQANDTADVIYGDNIMEYPGAKIYNKGRIFSKNDINMPFCHQSVIVKGSLAKKYPFDLKYKVASDYNMFYKLYKSGKSFQYIPVAVSNYNMDGFSQYNIIQTFTEVRKIQKRDKGIRYHLEKIFLYLKIGIKKYIPTEYIHKYRHYKYQ